MYPIAKAVSHAIASGARRQVAPAGGNPGSRPTARRTMKPAPTRYPNRSETE
ncbi:MAG: hypothetical protein ABSB42_20110 [Tepidisphaeraceae bacterium]